MGGLENACGFRFECRKREPRTKPVVETKASKQEKKKTREERSDDSTRAHDVKQRRVEQEEREQCVLP